jgi:hypothetical protein
VTSERGGTVPGRGSGTRGTRLGHGADDPDLPPGDGTGGSGAADAADAPAGVGAGGAGSDARVPTAGGSAPPPGAKRRAIAAEQAHLERVHDRVEDLRSRADARVAEAAAGPRGSTFQARFERDVTAHHHAARAARYTVGDVESLAFGRLDLADGDTIHVGRLSVVDEDGEVVLVDWRAPAAAAFYQATAAQPEGVARRRTLTTRGREVRDLDDEVLDADAADALGLVAVTGQGALLASLERVRDGRMHDIVATIQRDQDRIVRAPATGTLVVSGGPGTGKTVVALHRVASLLYRDRERFEGRGVLVVGPSRAFTDFTSRVLPALGEDRAVQRPLAALAPVGSGVDGWDDPEVAAVKGDLAMVEVLRRTLAAVLPPIPPSTRVTFEGTTATVDGGEIARVRRRALREVRPDRPDGAYHARAEVADRALRTVLWRAWQRQHRRGGNAASEDRRGFDAALDDSAQVRMLRRCYWPDLDPDTVLARLAGGELDLDRLGDGLLRPDDRDRLRRAWSGADGWTIEDVALLDELDALLGRRPRPPAPPREDDGGMRVAGDAGPSVARVDVDAPDYRDFAHVVVDEAQDLTPMQWRTVARRGPYASWTVVGDLAQRSRVAEPATWEDVAELIGRRQVTITALRVNYRTPVEIGRVARAVLAATGHDPAAAPEAVRASGDAPRLHRDPELLAATVAVVADLVADRDGTVAVLAPGPRVDGLAAGLDTAADLDDVARGRVRVLDPRTAKGLEFDDVVVVAPDEIVAASSVGGHQLYVAVTRATRRLHVVAAPDARFPGEHELEPASPATRR